MVISLTLLSGCGSTNSDWEPTLYETVNNFDGVTMIALEETVSSTGLIVAFENTSDEEYTYGEYFLLEKNINGSWYQVPVAFDGNYGFNDIGYSLPSSDVKEWTVDWSWLYGNLNTGKYRIVKDILDARKAGDYDKYHLTAEFTVE
ncbi:immunoglobulin-like domain-containing protein [Bacillus sp. SM2101]|uniref:immunoglobulin-like domain-containing protein n=1 Tax=Bacillus sp. SM2101 TaxID=2805366 RepID=UPI001BDED4C8|nr:immunoglobulin-like domain-containing protein [Bacillus sp. SM2101]